MQHCVQVNGFVCCNNSHRYIEGLIVWEWIRVELGGSGGLAAAHNPVALDFGAETPAATVQLCICPVALRVFNQAQGPVCGRSGFPQEDRRGSLQHFSPRTGPPFCLRKAQVSLQPRAVLTYVSSFLNRALATISLRWKKPSSLTVQMSTWLGASR